MTAPEESALFWEYRTGDRAAFLTMGRPHMILAFHLAQDDSTASMKCGRTTLRHLFFHSVKTMQSSAQKPQE